MSVEFEDLGMAIFSGELPCSSCHAKFLEKEAPRSMQNFYCPNCGRWIGEVNISFASMSLTPFRIIHSQLPPGFYLHLHDNNARTIEDAFTQGNVYLHYKDVALVETFPITVDPNKIVMVAQKLHARVIVEEAIVRALSADARAHHYQFERQYYLPGAVRYELRFETRHNEAVIVHTYAPPDNEQPSIQIHLPNGQHAQSLVAALTEAVNNATADNNMPTLKILCTQIVQEPSVNIERTR